MPRFLSEAPWKFAPGSPSVPNWKGFGLGKCNLGLSDPNWKGFGLDKCNLGLSDPNWKGFGLDKCNLGLSDGLLRNQARNLALAQIATPSLKPSRDPADSSLWAGLAGSEHPKPRWQHAFTRVRPTSVQCMGTAKSAGRMSTWCSGWNSHKTNRGHRGDFRRVPFRTSGVDLEGRCGWFQNGKRVPIWKSRGGFPLCPSSCLLLNLCPSPSKAPVVRFPSKFLPTSASPGLSGCRRTPIGTPFPKKTIGTGRDGSGWVGTGQERSARHLFVAANFNWAQTLRRHPRWAGTATKSSRRVIYLRPMGSHETVLSGCRKGD
jgi:hypothetical protein